MTELKIGQPYAIHEPVGEFPLIEWAIVFVEIETAWVYADLFEIGAAFVVGPEESRGELSVQDVEPIARIQVKWDGCSHLEWHKQEVQLHLCGGHSWRDFAMMLQALFGIMLAAVRGADTDLADLSSVDVGTWAPLALDIDPELFSITEETKV